MRFALNVGLLGYLGRVDRTRKAGASREQAGGYIPRYLSPRLRSVLSPGLAFGRLAS